MKIGSCGFYRYRQSVCAALKTFAGSEGPVFDSSVSPPISALDISAVTESITMIPIMARTDQTVGDLERPPAVVGLRNEKLIDIYARFPGNVCQGLGPAPSPTASYLSRPTQLSGTYSPTEGSNRSPSKKRQAAAPPSSSTASVQSKPAIASRTVSTPTPP